MLFDLHNDYPTVIPPSEYKKYNSDSVATVTAVIWTSEFDAENALARVDDITNALRAVGHDIPIAIEDCGFIRDIGSFDFGKYFYCSLTWNHNNRFAGGALDDGALTRDGKRAIEKMNGKCAVDLAHLNRKSFFQALDSAKRPMCSHTGFGNHRRCLDAEQIAALTERRGIIGLCAVTAFTSAKTVGELASVIDGFVSKYGIDSLCIGTDFNGTVDLPAGFGSYADIDNLHIALECIGYTGNDIERIFYNNAKQFYEEILHERHL